MRGRTRTRDDFNDGSSRERAAVPEQPRPSASGDPFAAYLGLAWDDECTVRLTIRPNLLNSVGLLLGPASFALLDYSMASALFAQTTAEERIATISISINYVQSADHGDVICCSRLDRRNRRLGILSSEVRHQDGRLLATAIGSFAIYSAATLARERPGHPEPDLQLEEQ